MSFAQRARELLVPEAALSEAMFSENHTYA
jgi:hypothetical protein